MTKPIIIEEIKIQGLRAFLKPQSVLLHENRKINLVVLAPNGAGKSSLIDSMEYFFADKATLKRLGLRKTSTHAGREYVRHVLADKDGLKVSMRFRKGKEEFEGSRTGDPMPEAARRILPLFKVPFIIRDYELRDFVQGNHYDEIVKWFALEQLGNIQERLEQLKTKIKDMVGYGDSEIVRQETLKTLTGGVLSTWDEPTALQWLNKEVLADLSTPIKFVELSDQDPAFLELTRQSAKEQDREGLGHMNSLLNVIMDLFTPSTSTQVEPAGQIVAFEKAVLDFQNASTKENSIRSSTSNYVFERVWTRSVRVQVKFLLDHLLRNLACNPRLSFATDGHSSMPFCGARTFLAIFGTRLNTQM